MSIFKRKTRHQRGEVASFLTIVSMLVITAGIVIGTRINQINSPLNTSPFAAAEPTPIDLGYTGGRWFDGSQGLICAAEFTCNADPLIKKLEIRSLDGTKTFNLGVDITGRGNPNGSPLEKSITGACSNRSYGILVNWDPRIDYTAAQKANIKKATGYEIKKGQILLSLRQGPSDHKYFVYDRPAWLTGSEDAIFYFEYDAKTAGVTRRYSQIAKGKKGCGPETTPTPVSGTPTPTTPLTTGTLTPTVPVTGTLTPTTPLTGTLTPTVPVTTTLTPTLTPTVPVTGTLTPTVPVTGTLTPTTPLTGTLTPTVPVSGSPTPTPVIVNACNYNALVYVQECTSMTANGQCAKKTGTNDFMARALTPADLALFGTINNKQLAGGRYGQGPASRFTLFTGNVAEASSIISTFPYYVGKLGTELAYYRYDSSQSIPAGTDPTKPNNGMFIPPTFTHSNERYTNMEEAEVRLTMKKPDYRVVPEGNELKYCKNNILGYTIGACDLNAFNNKRYIDPKTIDVNRDPRDTVAGLTVGCGQNIVYGWTVQKCNANFDYVFVMDTSTSMVRTRDVESGLLKKDAAQAELQDFLTNIKNSGGDHRAALIQFSSRTNTRTVSPLTSNIDSVKAAANTLVYQEGTCIECGLRETYNLLTNFRADKSRRVVVVFLTDGLPNSDPGAPRAGGYEGEIASEGNKLKTLNTASTGNVPPTVIGIGYGDPSLAGNPQPGELISAELMRVIKLFTTDDTWAFSTAANVSISEVFNRVQSSLNSCTQAEQAFQNFMRSKDINNDGIINTVDLFTLYDAYFQEGSALEGDLNDDGVINSLDVSLLINDLGTVIEPDAESQ